jgi:Rrf2 family protein
VRLSEGVEWAVHCCIVLALVPGDRTLPTPRLAQYHGIPAPYLAKHLQALSQAGIVDSVPGRRGGYRLARPAADVTVYEVVAAVEGRGPAFRCSEIRRNGPAAGPMAQYRAPCPVASAMWRAEAAWREVLEQVTIADLLLQVGRVASPVSIRRAAEWMQGAVR